MLTEPGLELYALFPAKKMLWRCNFPPQCPSLLLMMVEKEPVKTLLLSDKLAKEDVPSLQYPAMKYVGLGGGHIHD
jgi:hypothetical protein